MEENLRAKLDALLRQHEEMQCYLQQLGKKCQEIDLELRQLSKSDHSKSLAENAQNLDELKDAIAEERKRTESTVAASTPPPIPPQAKVVKPSALSQATPEERRREDKPVDLPQALSEQEMNAPVPTEKPTEPAAMAGEWELNLGKVWFVRIGVILLLTGLIFLSTYAYKNWLFNAGPAAKVTFFMVISLTLTGIGVWLDQRKERFRQYGRVLASGGLAAGYYTVYASHFVPSLQLIDHPITAGILLTLWAGIILAYAVWKKSRVVAVMAIGLAFYGTIVNPSGWLSLFSALLLSSAGIWLMLKFRWVAIGLGTVAAAYISHAFWLGFYPQTVETSVRFTYLAAYWLLFTAALTTTKARHIAEPIQRAFCAINNGAAWGLAVFSVPMMVPHSDIGWISIIVGSLWIAISWLARRGKLWDPALSAVFGYQGILVASLGMLLEATGYTRFLVMAVEACILLAGARYFGGWLARVVSAGAFLAALLTALPGLNGGQLAAWPSYAALALFGAIYTALVRRDGQSLADDEKISSNPAPTLAAFITWVVAGMGVFQQWSDTAGINGLMITAAVIMLTHFLFKKPQWKTWICDVAMVSTFACLAGILWYLMSFTGLSLAASLCPWLAVAVFWYFSPKLTQAWDENAGNQTPAKNQTLEWLFSLLFWIMTALTLLHHVKETSTWLILAGVIAIAGHASAEYLRRPSIGAPALLFHILALVFVTIEGNSEPALGWMPAIMLLIHLILVDKAWSIFEKPLLRATLAMGLVMAVGIHAFQEFDRPDLTLTALGLGLMPWAYRRADSGFAMTGGTFPLVIACISTVANHGDQDWLRYIPILATLMMHGLLWRGTQLNVHWVENWKPLRVILLVAGLVTLFYASTVHVKVSFDGAGAAICWALLAATLFCAGLIMRCRPYRLIGLWWLAAAVLHVVCIDVMKLDTLGRILSFISLGLVMLALGFVYNKFQETIRKFL